MEKLEIGFVPQGYIVTFSLELAPIRKIKENFPNAYPINRVSVGYQNVKDTLEPFREPITKYVLPLLTGLTPQQLATFKEIVILRPSTNHQYLKIVSSQKEEQKTLELATA